jgi:hypothetical protein
MDSEDDFRWKCVWTWEFDLRAFMSPSGKEPVSILSMP